MKNKILASGIFMVFMNILLGQTDKTPLVVSSENTSKYIIGIGNEDAKIYYTVLEDLKASTTIKVSNYCESNQIIAMIVKNDEFKSYDVLRDFLTNNYPDILLFKKEETILNLDCKDQISKQ